MSKIFMILIWSSIMIHLINGQSNHTSPSNRIREKKQSKTDDNQQHVSSLSQRPSSSQRMNFAIKSAHGSQNGFGMGGGGLVQSVYNKIQNSDGTKSSPGGGPSKKVPDNDDHGGGGGGGDHEQIDQKTLNKIKEIINAAVRTRFSIETKEADFDEDDQQTPQVIEIGGK